MLGEQSDRLFVALFKGQYLEYETDRAPLMQNIAKDYIANVMDII